MRHLLNRRMLIRILPLASLIGFVAVSGPSAPANATSARDSNPTSSGWTYFPATVNLTNVSYKTIPGMVSSSGECILTDSGVGIVGSSPTTEIETAENPSTCQVTYELGTPSSSATSNPAGTTTTTSTKQFSSVGIVPGTSTSSSTKQFSSVGIIPDIVSFNVSAYQNNQWLDPFGIQVSAQQQNLNWTSNGVGDTAWTESVSWSRLTLDGWSTRWTYDNSNRTAPANSLANSSFQNSLFCAPYTTYSYFGWNGSSRINDPLVGYPDGTYSWAYDDPVNGCCVDLLHHGHTDGFLT